MWQSPELKQSLFECVTGNNLVERLRPKVKIGALHHFAFTPITFIKKVKKKTPLLVIIPTDGTVVSSDLHLLV
jgi:hypothetical protein